MTQRFIIKAVTFIDRYILGFPVLFLEIIGLGVFALRWRSAVWVSHMRAYMLGMLKSLMLSSLPLWQSGVDDHDVAQAFRLGLDDASISFDTNVLQKLQVRNRVETALLAQKELKKS